MRLCLFMFIMFCAAGCATIPKEWSSIKYSGSVGWPPKQFSKVVAYSFKAPGVEGVLTKAGVDTAKLKAYQTAQAVLSKEQTTHLLGAVVKPKVKITPSLCYFPHHVFVFYSNQALPVAAVEICFGCNTIKTWPSLNYMGRSDFVTLARLSDELGLGLGSAEVTLESCIKRLAKYQQRANKQEADAWEQLERIKARNP